MSEEPERIRTAHDPPERRLVVVQAPVHTTAQGLKEIDKRIDLPNHDVLVTTRDTDVAELPPVDALADRVADRVVEAFAAGEAFEGDVEVRLYEESDEEVGPP